MRRLIYTGVCGLLITPSIGLAQEPGPNGTSNTAEKSSSEVLRNLVTDVEQMKRKVDALLAIHNRNQNTTMPVLMNQLDNVERGLQETQLKLSRLQDEMRGVARSNTEPGKPIIVEPKSKPIEPTVTSKQPMTIQEQLEEISRKMDDMRGLKTQVDAQGKEISELKKKQDMVSSFQVQMEEDMIRLRQEVARLQTQMNQMRGISEENASSSRYRPMPSPGENTNNATPAPAVRSGTIQLVNNYSIPVTVYVDATPYTLQPGDQRSVNHQVGSFQYAVAGYQRYVTRSLAAGETFTINIHP